MAAEPLRRLRLRAPRVELRLAGSRDEILALARVAERGIFAPGEMFFAVPWPDAIGGPDWPASFVEFHEQSLAAIEPDDWSLRFFVFVDGEPIGSQDVVAERFAERGIVSTGSWLGAEFQRRGIGTEMRSAVLTFAFDGLGAVEARSGAMLGNEASRRVSEKLGYQALPDDTISPHGTPIRHTPFRLTRDRWRPPVPVELIGVEECLRPLGAPRRAAGES
jgi:RimJ/RimL family protein N-acetyltransferase